MKKLSNRPKSRPLARVAVPVLAVALATSACTNMPGPNTPGIGASPDDDIALEPGVEPTPSPTGEPGADAGNDDAGAESFDAGVSPTPQDGGTEPGSDAG